MAGSLLAVEESIVYSYLNIPATSLPSTTSTPAQHQTCPQCPPWHRIALRAGWAGNIILLGTVMALLAVLVSRNPQPVAAIPNTTEKSKSYEIHRNTTVYNRSLEECWISRSREDFRACLKQYLCEVENSSAEGSGCKLCPSHWQLHRDKCYWLSKKDKDWTMGQEDCSRKNSHLLMIQDWEEMVFIQNITKQQNEVWIGLNITSPGRSWTWVDGSPLNKKLFTVLGPAEEKSCAAIRNDKIQSESCLTRYRWICQKESVLI